MYHADLVRPLHESLRDHAEHIGDRVAFSDDRRQVSYSELERRTRWIAAHLARLGTGRGERVAVHLDSGVEFIETMLAITRAAAVATPINPRSSDAELARLLDDSGASVVVTDTAHLAQVTRVRAERPRLLVVVSGIVSGMVSGVDSAADVVSLDELAQTDPGEPARDDLGWDDPAWLLYTSGTTGPARGALSSQRRAVSSVLTGFAPVVGLTQADEVLWPLPLFHSFAHAVCLLGITTIGAGARITDGSLPETTLRQLDEHPITVLAGVPTTFHQLVRAAHTTRPATSGLRLAVSAGASCPPALRRSFEAALGVELLDAYGSTETGGVIAIGRPGDTGEESACGLPAPGTELRIVDPTSEADVPAGAEGEIWVRSQSLMISYHGRPDATAAVLRDGWYRTGDLGRLGPLGHLTVTGRLKELIICGGENIHPTEVEQVLLRAVGVADAAVIGRPHDVLGEVPEAYLVPSESGVDPKELLAACRRELSSFKVPAAFYEIEAVPRVGPGKIARTQIPGLPRRLLAGGDQAVAAELTARLRMLTPADQEHTVLDIVVTEAAAVCGVAPATLAPHRPFTEFGLTSLGAVELRNRLGAATGLELVATLMYDHPTPTALADHLRHTLLGTDRVHQPATATPVETPTDTEPVAIVGIGCRYPGDIASPDDLWALVDQGTDAITGFPTDRGWHLDDLYDPDPDRIGKSYTRNGGFLDCAADFDPAPFGISPREAMTVDPQQRLLLQTSWEAMERAGIDPASLAGSATGVFVGVMYSDYGGRFSGVAHELEAQLVLGSAGSVASGRIAYAFGLRGPTVTLDTACSSSLVAVHQAARALRAGECSLALAGGATVMSTPNSFVAFSRQRALSADGRCKAFSDSADGTAWAEGVAVVVLERLSDAVRNGHPVLAVVRGSAVNSDGASNGLTAPNGQAQQRVVRAALADAGLTTADVDAVEAHGTGTTLGDPIEAQALLATYGQGRTGDPVWLGSLKSNLGHTQAAAGVGGMIKMMQAMRHGRLPRTLHVTEPSKHVNWSDGAVRLLVDEQPWPASERPRRAGVSAFGIGGTNAHVIIEEPPAALESHVDRAAVPAPPWLLSAADPTTLRTQAARLADVAESSAKSIVDIGYSLATRRAALPYRAAVPAADPALLADGLRALRDGEPFAGIAEAVADPATRPAFLFTGQGAQHPEMGRELCAAFPTFADSLAETCAHLDEHLDRPLRSVLHTADAAGLLDRTDFTQPALFAYEVALFRLLESWRIRPHHLVGHSVGELAAAHVAGVLSLADAALLVTARGRLMRDLPAGGAMVAIHATEEELADAIAEAGVADRAGIATVNGPRAVVISGEESAVLAVAGRFADAGRRIKRLRVSHAFHSPLMDPMLAEFRDVVAGLTFAAPRFTIVSTVTGQPAGAELGTPDYWVRHARDAVRFADAVRHLEAAGVTTFLEVGPDTVLSTLAEDCVTATDLRFLATARKATPEVGTVLDSVAGLHTAGASVGWREVYADHGARPVDLPTYPFRRQRFWLDPAPVRAAGGLGHPLLDNVFTVPDGDQVLATGTLSTAAQPWLTDHVISGEILVPASAFVEMAVRVADEVGLDQLDDFAIVAPLAIRPGETTQVQVVLDAPDSSGGRPVTVHSRPDGLGAEEPWTRHAAGVLRAATAAPAFDLSAWPPPDAEPVDVSGRYDELAVNGYEYGAMFRGIRNVWRRGEDLFAEVALPDEKADGAGRFGMHPALLDSTLHTRLLADSTTEVRLPFEWTGVRLYATGASALRVRVRPASGDAMALEIADRAGQPVASIESLVTRSSGPAGQGAVDAVVRQSLFRVTWSDLPLGQEEPVGQWQLLGTDELGLTDVLPILPEAAEQQPDVLVMTTRGLTGPDADVVTEVHALAARFLTALQTWQDEPRWERSRLLVVTHDATTDTPNLASAAIWGMVRSAQSENPDRILLVDLDGRPESAALLPAVVATGEPQVAIRAGTATIPRLARALTPGDEPSGGEVFDPDGTVLVTGAFGALGVLTARHLVAEHGVRHLALVSRQGERAAGAAELRAELESLGAAVRVVACDVSDRAALAAVVDDCEPPLRGVVHTAGVLDDGVLSSLGPDRLAKVLRPKVNAVWHLHEITRALDLTAFVIYSSAAGVLGNAGQSNYATGNSFLDALARSRRSAGLPAASMAWGLWDQDSGMSTHVSGMARDQLARRGFPAITDEQGMGLFDAALAVEDPVTVPLRVDVGALRSAGGQVPPPLRSLVRTQRRAATDEGGASWLLRLAAVSGAEREKLLVELVRGEVAAVLGYADPAALPPKGFIELGLDSLTSVQLRNRLSEGTGVRLPATVAFDHPTAAELAKHLAAALESVPDTPGAVAAPAYTLSALYRTVCAAGRPAAGMQMLAGASWATPTFAAADAAAHTLAPTELSAGTGGPLLACFMSLVPSIGVGEYAKFARAFADEADVLVFSHPGLGGGLAVPEDLDTLTAMHAESVREHAAGRPVVVVGHSTGGALGHAVAARLERMAAAPAGLALIDTYHVTHELGNSDWFLSLAARSIDNLEARFESDVDDATLAVMGAYMRMFSGWRPESIEAPTLQLRATEPTPEMPAEGWRASWPEPHRLADVPGDHFTMMDEHAETTAAALRSWHSSLLTAR
ncbi:MAG: SDR family NAD(P)-dependent oxidoreductase [Actinophytocola sp.]|uniref:SDR family NAD(P)-dependent oxidoreductase n=1 Tax=Actinophytocola sp. TaxID=1872138 RepID=UPI003D6BF026